MLDSACKPGTQSRTQSIKVLLQSMPDPACKPVPTVLDARGNASPSKTVSSGERVNQALKRRFGASVRTRRPVAQRLGISPMRRTRNNDPLGNSTYYYAYFPNEMFRGAIKGYLINVYGREQHHERTVAPARFTLLTPATDDNAETSETDSSWTIIGDVTRQA